MSEQVTPPEPVRIDYHGRRNVDDFLYYLLDRAMIDPARCRPPWLLAALAIVPALAYTPAARAWGPHGHRIATPHGRGPAHARGPAAVA